MPVIDVKKEEQETRETKPKTYTWLGILILVSSVFVIGSIFGVLFLFSSRSQSKIDALTQDLAGLKQKEKQKEKEAAEAIEVSAKLKELNNVLAEHVCLTNVFKELEKTTVKKVFFESLELSSVDPAGLSLAAKAGTYQDAANQLAVWRSREDFFKEVTVADVSLQMDEGSGKSFVTFMPSMKLEASKFLCRLEKENKNGTNNKF